MNIFKKIKEGLKKTTAAFTKQIDNILYSLNPADPEFFEQLEEVLIMADVGVETSLDIVAELRARVKEKTLKDPDEIKAQLRDILVEILSAMPFALELDKKPAIILIIGVNGVGKTTTIGKLAAQFKQQGKKVVLAAGDTFRAAATAQLDIWAGRAGVDIIKQGEGADPASVLFDAISAAKARNADIIICDTAGRLHNKQNLMNELAKMSKIIDRELPGSSRETLLVIDATTGQNGISQATEFSQTAGITGIVLTKLDGTAKGGIVIAICKMLSVPVKFLGVGEQADDLLPFDPEAFVDGLITQ